MKASRSLGGISRPGPRYTNPVRAENSPDPGVTRLADGSGWVAVTTSDHADHQAPAETSTVCNYLLVLTGVCTRTVAVTAGVQHNSTAFPLLFSRDLVLQYNTALEYTVFRSTGSPGASSSGAAPGRPGPRTPCGRPSSTTSTAATSCTTWPGARAAIRPAGPPWPSPATPSAPTWTPEGRSSLPGTGNTLKHR